MPRIDAMIGNFCEDLVTSNKPLSSRIQEVPKPVECEGIVHKVLLWNIVVNNKTCPDTNPAKHQDFHKLATVFLLLDS